MGAEWATVKGAVRQPVFRDLAFQKLGAHLDVVLKAFFRGPVLRLFAVEGWAGRDRAKLRREGQREAGFRSTREEGRKAQGGSRRVWRGVRRVKGLPMVFSVLPLSPGPGCEADAPLCFSQRGFVWRSISSMSSSPHPSCSIRTVGMISFPLRWQTGACGVLVRDACWSQTWETR